MKKSLTIHIGPMKTASTFFYDCCQLLPLGLTRRKETFYFSLFKRSNIGDFFSLFDRSCHDYVHIEPSYFSSLFALEGLKTFFPDAKIVICLRNYESLLSSYLLHLYSLGKLSKSTIANVSISEYPLIKPIDYSLFVPPWLESFENVFFYSFSDFTSSLVSRKRILFNLFPFLKRDDFDLLAALPPSNVSRLYHPWLSPLRRLTPYINILPCSNGLLSLKSLIMKYTGQRRSLPSINVNQDLAFAYADKQINFFGDYSNFNFL